MFDVLGGDLQITTKSLMTLDEVLKAVDGRLLSNTQENDFYFVDVACDSRKVKKDFIFFPSSCSPSRLSTTDASK